MIVKKVLRSVPESSFKNLSYYILDTKKKNFKIGKKVHSFRFSNCSFEQNDIEENINEILNTQSLNNRAKSDKTMHLIVSFREFERPNLEILHKIEDELLKSIDMHECQRLSVVHDDTNNLHMHIAINCIHPKTLRIISTKYDIPKLHKRAEELEVEYSLTFERHFKKYLAEIELTEEEKQSNVYLPHFKCGLEMWLKEKAGDELKRILSDENLSLETLTDFLNSYGVSLRERRRGFVIQSNTSAFFCKASSVNRALSKPALEKRFGKIEFSKEQRINHPLWELYCQKEMERRYKKEQEIMRLRKLIKIRRQTKQSFIGINKEFANIRSNFNYLNFREFLIAEAMSGNTNAAEYLKITKSPIPNEHDNMIRGEKRYSRYTMLNNPSYITQEGFFVYKEGTDKIIDKGDYISFNINANDEKLFLKSLELCIKKYGNNLSIRGDDNFKRKIFTIADKYSIKVTFTDESQKDISFGLEQENREYLRDIILASIKNTYNTYQLANDEKVKDSIEKSLKKLDDMYIKTFSDDIFFKSDLQILFDEQTLKSMDMLSRVTDMPVIMNNEHNQKHINLLNREAYRISENRHKQNMLEFMEACERGRIKNISLAFYKNKGIENIDSFVQELGLHIEYKKRSICIFDLHTNNNKQILKSHIKDMTLSINDKSVLIKKLEHLRSIWEQDNTKARAKSLEI